MTKEIQKPVFGLGPVTFDNTKVDPSFFAVGVAQDDNDETLIFVKGGQRGFFGTNAECVAWLTAAGLPYDKAVEAVHDAALDVAIEAKPVAMTEDEAEDFDDEYNDFIGEILNATFTLGKNVGLIPLENRLGNVVREELKKKDAEWRRKCISWLHSHEESVALFEYTYGIALQELINDGRRHILKSPKKVEAAEDITAFANALDDLVDDLVTVSIGNRTDYPGIHGMTSRLGDAVSKATKDRSGDWHRRLIVLLARNKPETARTYLYGRALSKLITDPRVTSGRKFTRPVEDRDEDDRESYDKEKHETREEFEEEAGKIADGFISQWQEKGLPVSQLSLLAQVDQAAGQSGWVKNPELRVRARRAYNCEAAANQMLTGIVLAKLLSDSASPFFNRMTQAATEQPLRTVREGDQCCTATWTYNAGLKSRAFFVLGHAYKWLANEALAETKSAGNSPLLHKLNQVYWDGDYVLVVRLYTEAYPKERMVVTQDKVLGAPADFHF